MMCRHVLGVLRRFAWAAALTVALPGPSRSHAGTLAIDFDLSSSALVFDSALLSIPSGMGTTATGMARVTLTGVDASGVVTGTAAAGTLSDLELLFSIDTPILHDFDANLIGPLLIVTRDLA